MADKRKDPKERFTLTRSQLRSLVDEVTSDKMVSGHRLPCYFGTADRDRIIDRLLRKVKKL